VATKIERKMVRLLPELIQVILPVMLFPALVGLEVGVIVVLLGLGGVTLGVGVIMGVIARSSI
jgi:hypothetical protein